MKDYEIMLKDKLEQAQIVVSDAALEKFRIYAEQLIEWNKKMNLTAIDDYWGIYEKHFLDSVLPMKDIDFKGKLLDVGAGAGFPSIPILIVNDKIEVTIVEPLGKRCNFLSEVVKCLSLSNITIINERAEDYIKTKREYFDIVTARAVANLTLLSELCIPYVKLNGIFVALKSAQGNEEYETASKAINILGCELTNKYEYDLNDAKRINLVFTKVKKTPIMYPRSFAKIKKEPLGVK